MTYIHEYMENLGGMPALGSSPGGKWNEASFDMTEMMNRMKLETTYVPIIDIGIMQDDKNPSKHILYVSLLIYSFPLLIRLPKAYTRWRGAVGRDSGF